MSWALNPFPGAYSYWTISGGTKTEVANPPEDDEWYQADSDSDGLNNAQEVQFGSDPYRLDSDLDGLPDSVEFQYSNGATTAMPYDPWIWDSNSNGFSDFDEFYQQIQGYNPVVNYNGLAAGSFFSYSDADGDGLKNFEDSEPFNTDRDGDGILNWNEAAGQMDDPYNGAGPPPPTDPGVIIGGNWYPTGTMDSDGDGTPDQYDPFPYGSFWYQGIEYGGASSDRDGDGIPDVADSFPDGSYWYGTLEYALPWVDQDGDGIPDALDPWPTIAGSYWYNGTEYAGIWSDQDMDGIPDALDYWPNDWWNGAAHFNYNGVEYPGSSADDRDSDGIPDNADAYPDDPTNRADTDGDGLSDYDENTQYGTDPAKVDTDDDRLSDSDELFRYHTNPLLAKTNPDQPYSDFYMVNMTDDDSDGIPNGVEQWYADQGLGMNPADPADARGDLDGDGYTNLQAWQNGWSLTAHSGTYDYDQDGILDVLEDAWNAAYPGMFDNHNFNDSVEDFDGDGLMNFEEIALGLNPGKANSRHVSVSDVQEWAWRGRVVGGPAGLSYAGLGFTGSVQPEWQVTGDANHDGVPDGLMAFVTALNADATLVTLPQRVASGDYDGDGMPDFWEHRYNLDLRSAADAQANPDGDTLINSLEYAHGRNPLVSDDPPPEDPPLLPPDDPTATPHFVTTSLPDGAVNAGYNAGIAVSGGTGPYQFSLSGSLPDGLYLDENGGITGTPTTEMSGSFTVQVVDGTGLSAEQAFTLNIMPDAAGGGGGGGDPPPPPLTITTTNAQMNAITYMPFSVTLEATGGTSNNYLFSANPGTLPAGLEYNEETNTIHGTPTATGSCSFSVTVNVSGSASGSVSDTSATKEFLLTVSDPLAFTTDAELPFAPGAKTYSQQIEVSGGYGQKLFSLSGGALPSGIALTAGGQLTGASYTSGSYAFTVRVTDAVGHAKDQAFTLYVGEPLQPLAITTASLPTGGVGLAYSASIGASGGDSNYTFSGGGGPFSVSSNGSISGVPTEAGVHAVSVTVTDTAEGTASATFVIVVAEPTLEVTSGNLQILKVGDTPEPVTVSLTAGDIGLAGVQVSMGSQTTITDEGGNATFLPPALMTDGAHDFAVNAAGYGATVQMFAYTLPAGAGGTAPEILPGPPDDPPVTPVEDDDVIVESRSVSFTSGTLQASYSGGMAVAYVGGQFQVYFDSSIHPSYNSSKTSWTTSDGQSGEGTPPPLESVSWRRGLAGGYDRKYPDTDSGPVDGPDNDSNGVIWPQGIPLTHIYNGSYYGKSVGRQKHTTTQIRIVRKTVEEGGSGSTEAINKPFLHAIYTKGPDGVETLSNSNTDILLIAANQNATPPKELNPVTTTPDTTKQENEAPYQININDTPETRDDIVRKEQKVGDKAWRQWIPCTVIIPNASGSQTTSIAVSSEGDTMKFAQDTQPPPNDATAGEASITVALEAQGETKKGRFWITGITQSANKDDAKLQIKKNSATGELITTKSMTVFWYVVDLGINADTSITKTFDGNLNLKYYGLGDDPVRFVCHAQVVPTQVDSTVPQISDWQFGIVQNAQGRSSYCKTNPSAILTSTQADDDRLIVPSKVIVNIKQAMYYLDINPYKASQILFEGLEPNLEQQSGDSTFNPQIGRDSGKAHYYAQDGPSILWDYPLQKPLKFPATSNPAKIFNVDYPNTQWRDLTYLFHVWGGLVNVKSKTSMPTPGVFVPIRQKNWSYYSDSRIDTPQKPKVETDKDPDVVPIISPPIANNTKTQVYSVDTELIDDDDEKVEIISPKTN